MGWVEWARTRQPFALVIDSFDAHEPWDVPKRISDMYGPPDASGVEPIQPFPTPAAKYSRAGAVAVAAAPHARAVRGRGDDGRHLAREVPRPPRQPGVLDNTLVVLTSDHGVLLGEYGWVGKRYTEVHTELSHVPFAIRHPAGKAKGKASRYWASHHDIGPTVLSVLGYDKPGFMNGTDLSPLLDGKQPAPEAQLPHRGLQRPTWPRATTSWLLISDNRGATSASTRCAREGARTWPAATRSTCAGCGATSARTPARRACRTSSSGRAAASSPPRPRCGPGGKTG